MKNKIIIYDPPMCCSSGVCGPNPDQTLIDFQNTYAKLKQSGSDIERYIITQSPEKFKENPQIIKLIQEQQLKVLPITTVNDVVVKTGSYPTGIELQNLANTGGCCSDQNACDLRCSPLNGGCNNNEDGGCC